MTDPVRAAAKALCDAPLDIDPATQPTIARHVAAIRAALAAPEPSDEEVAREMVRVWGHNPDDFSGCEPLQEARGQVEDVRAAEQRAKGTA